jgi:hypothetical protein
MERLMTYSAPPTHVEFNDQSPDTIEVRPVTSTDLTTLKIPPEAASFRFVTEMPGAPPATASPLYYLGREFGAPEVMAAKYPNHAVTIDYWLARSAVEAFGKFEWDYEAGGKRWQGFGLIPLVDGVALFDKATGRVVWPMA